MEIFKSCNMPFPVFADASLSPEAHWNGEIALETDWKF
jgi:hypothetical protein